ncbi:uncharacterized protein [Haliotis cracherodii]|uniref:uncharacterized protein n=1 Tax=Haliotis cracherodii TaxID=6455 RepID=UPI0039E91E1F
MSTYANMNQYDKDLIIRFPLNFDIWAPPRQRATCRYFTILDPLSELPASHTPNSVSTSVSLTSPTLPDASHFEEIDLHEEVTQPQSTVRTIRSRVTGFFRSVFRARKMDA